MFVIITEFYKLSLKIKYIVPYLSHEKNSYKRYGNHNYREKNCSNIYWNSFVTLEFHNNNYYWNLFRKGIIRFFMNWKKAIFWTKNIESTKRKIKNSPLLCCFKVGEQKSYIKTVENSKYKINIEKHQVCVVGREVRESTNSWWSY